MSNTSVAYKHIKHINFLPNDNTKNTPKPTSPDNITQFPCQKDNPISTPENTLNTIPNEHNNEPTQLSMFVEDSTDINPIAYERGKAPHQKTSPIKEADTVNRIYEALIHSGRYGKRNAAIFILQILIGRRTSDILRFRVEDIYDYRENSIRQKIALKESKTGKMIVGLAIDDYHKEILDSYVRSLKNRSPQAYLFPSQKKNPDGTQKPINVTSLNEIYKENTEAIFKELGIPDQTHMSSYHARKTYGYRLYHTYMSSDSQGLMENGIHVLDFLQALYNHKDQTTTLRYIGAWDDISKEVANKIAERYAMSQELKDLMKN